MRVSPTKVWTLSYSNSLEITPTLTLATLEGAQMSTVTGQVSGENEIGGRIRHPALRPVLRAHGAAVCGGALTAASPIAEMQPVIPHILERLRGYDLRLFAPGDIPDITLHSVQRFRCEVYRQFASLPPDDSDPVDPADLEAWHLLARRD